MTTIRVALLLSFAERNSVFLVGLLSSIILARLLTPQEIGMFSVGAAAVAIAHTLRDFGVPTYIVQESELTEPRLQTAFTLMLVVGWGLGILLMGIAPLVGSFYDSSSVGNVVMILALNFFLLPFGTITQALFRRELNYRVLYGLNMLEVTTSLVVAVTLAFMGMGYISLAIASVAAVSAKVLGCLIIRPGSVWRRPAFPDISRVIGFSQHVSGAFILQEVGRGGTEMIVGRTLGFASAGLLSRANGVANLADTVVTSAVRGVALPYFAVSTRENKELGDIYVKGQAYLSVASWSVLALVGVSAEQVVDLLFGAQWLLAVPVAQILVFAVGLATVSKFSISTLLGCGASSQVLKIESVVQPLRLFCVLIGVGYGLNGVGLALVFTEIVAVIVTVTITCRVITVDKRRLLFELGRAFIVAATTALLAYIGLIYAVALQIHNILIFVAAFLMAAFGWLLAAKVTGHPILLEVWRLLKSMRPA